MKLIPKVTSLADLKARAKADPRYAQLAKIAACNLGCGPTNWPEQPTLAEALRWLELNADETSERGVVAEINFVRDLITEERSPNPRPSLLMEVLRHASPAKE